MNRVGLKDIVIVSQQHLCYFINCQMHVSDDVWDWLPVGFDGLGHNTVFDINLIIHLIELVEFGQVLYFISVVANDKVGLNS